jgi:predicted DNA-binding protein (MmcQ/YjbR family)
MPFARQKRRGPAALCAPLIALVEQTLSLANKVESSEPVSSTERALSQLRKLCLSLPETSETNSWGHPNFRAGKRIFAAFEAVGGRPSVAIRVDSADADLLLLHRKEFFSTPYGRGKWVSTWADGKLDWALLGGLIERSYRKVALKRMIAALDKEQARDHAPA